MFPHFEKWVGVKLCFSTLFVNFKKNNLNLSMALASKILSILPMGIWEFFEPIDYYFLLDSLVNLLATLRFTPETCRFRFINLLSKIWKNYLASIFISLLDGIPVKRHFFKSIHEFLIVIRQTCFFLGTINFKLKKMSSSPLLWAKYYNCQFEEKINNRQLEQKNPKTTVISSKKLP